MESSADDFSLNIEKISVPDYIEDENKEEVHKVNYENIIGEDFSRSCRRNQETRARARASSKPI
jgi:hypothetical protein